ncbi:hypothetical protein BS78_03G185900 [Paspalum vaginatum]|nr:hypothetical protein BS78_03G185900 [Paspalum vaginatum]
MTTRLLHLEGGPASEILILILSVVVSGRGCVASELEALVSFKKSFIDPTGLLSTWRGEDCCGWKGIQCDSHTGHVFKLGLSGPEDSMVEPSLSGQIMNSSIIASLQHLRYLDLSFIEIIDHGTREPFSFSGNLNNLRYLNLWYAGFPDSIPSNTYPYESDLTWLPQLSSLTSLDMSGLNLSSARDWVRKVNMLPNLRTLSLSACYLDNTISTLSHSNLTHLEILDLSFSPLYSLLQYNWFWDMTLRNLCNLQVVNLDQNSINRDMMERLPQCSWSKLHELRSQTANLSAQLPVWIGNLTNLNYLDISQNMLVGSIPFGIGNMRRNLTSLTDLCLSRNMLNGSLPFRIGTMRSLSYLDLSDNMLAGDIASSSLSMLHLRNNNLSGEFPRFLQNATELSFLDLLYNKFSGIVLILRSDMFHDHLPKQLTSLIGLHYLDIAHNNLSGSIPSSLASSDSISTFIKGQELNCTHEFTKHTVLIDLSSNGFTGHITKELSSLKGLRSLNLSNNEISGSISNDIGSLKRLESLNLSYNHFNGKIP